MEETEFRWEVAAVILTHKIKCLAPSKFSDLGLMTFGDIKNGMLYQFNDHEVETAIEFAGVKGELDIYYEVQCNECNYVEYVLEVDPSTRESSQDIIESKFNCVRCNAPFDEGGSLTELTQLYAIPVEALGGLTEEVELVNEDALTRTFRWMFSWLRKDK